MVLAIDHIEALRKQLIDKQLEKERELQEIQDMIRTLGAAPRVLSGQPATQKSQERDKAVGTPYNLNLSKQVDDYIAGCCKFDEAISIPAMIKTLKAEQGVRGKDKSLYAYIHKLLKDRADDKASLVQYTKGVGFFKSRKSDNIGTNDSTLVAQV